MSPPGRPWRGPRARLAILPATLLAILPAILPAILMVAAMIGAYLSGPEKAEAHAIILESVPGHEESLASPARLVLRFNSRLEKPLCSVQLVGPHRHAIGQLRAQPNTAADTLAYLLPPLDPGAYQARWRVMATDGHVTEGIVLFTVLPPGAARPR